MSWLSRLSLLQRGLIGLMALIAVAFGAIAVPQLKQQLLPSIDLPMVSVIAPYQGASPDVVEKQVVEPLEDNIQGVDGITSVNSTASEGSAVVMAQFDYGDKSEQTIADVQQAVNRTRATLPDGVDPQVVAGGTDDIPTVVLAASADGRDQQSLSDALDSSVIPVLKDIKGVSQVTVDGVQDQVVAVTPDTKKLAKARLSPADLSKALQSGGASVPAYPSPRTARARPSRSATASPRSSRSRGCASPPRAGAGTRSASVTSPRSGRPPTRPPPSPAPTGTAACPSR